MKIVRNLLMVLMLIPAFCLCANAQDWRQIVPLKSTRAQVERLLGTATEAYFADYELKQGSLFIEYSSGPCRPERNGGWNVPRDVVIMLDFTPKHKTRIADLKLDPKKFRKIVDDHVIGVLYYVNDEEGITYAVSRWEDRFCRVRTHAKR